MTVMQRRPDTLKLLDGDEACEGFVSVGDPAAITPGDLQCLVDNGVKKIQILFDQAEEDYIEQVISYSYDLTSMLEVTVGVMPAHTWLAYSFISEFADDKEALVKAVIRFDERIYNPIRIAHMALHFFPVIEEHLGPLEQPIGELYAAYRQANNRKKSNDIIKNAAATAATLSSTGQYDEAKETLFDGYRQSESLLKMSKLKPVRTLNQRLDEHAEGILAHRDRDVLGLKTDMAELTSALLGLRGLIFLGGGPNLGKTVLATQLALQVLQNEPDACCVYINLDMDTDDLITRIRCHLGGFEWKDFVRGHGIPIDAGRKEVEAIGDRLVILDGECFNGDVQEVLDVIEDAKKKTKCKRVLVVLDYIQVWQLPEHLRKILRSDNDIDEWRVEVVKQLKRSIDKHDAVVAISEVRKEAYGRELGMEDLKGSSRLSYAGDVVLLLQTPTTDEFVSHFDAEGAGITVWWPNKRDIEDMDKKLKDKSAPKIKDALQQQSVAAGFLAVAKGRDGTVRKRIAITSHFKTATIVEGFYIDGPPKKQAQGDKTNDLERIFSVDEGGLPEDSYERKSEWWNN